MSLVKNPNLKEGERSRIALELASCLLYNLEKPSEALTVLDEYLVESELDSSAIYFDAYFTSKQFDSCFRILRAAEVNAESNEERSILAFKSAKLYLEQGLLSDTISALKKTLELDANFHEAYELIVMSFAQEGDFSGISQYLDQWIKFIHSPNLKSQVNTFKTEFLLQNMQRINSLQNSQ